MRNWAGRPPGHELTDMHDWGDMLVQTGFAEPVMDMERITLTYATPARLLQDLAELGRNFHPARFPALRGRAWKARLEDALARHLVKGEDGRLSLTFEVIYGHALKAPPKVKVSALSAVSVADMRSMLQGGSGPAPENLPWPCCAGALPACGDRRLRAFSGERQGKPATIQNRILGMFPSLMRPMPGMDRCFFGGLPHAAANASVSFCHLARAGRPQPRCCAVASQASLFTHPGPAGVAVRVAVRRFAGHRGIFLGTGRHHGDAFCLGRVAGGGRGLCGVCPPCGGR
jgi:hypothetical protein